MMTIDCCNCSKTFVSRDAYHDHVRTVQSANSAVFACCQCHRLFVNQCELWSHNKLHTGEPQQPQHMCKYCGQSFSEECLLKAHIHEHDVEFERLKVLLECEELTTSQDSPELPVVDTICIDDDDDDDDIIVPDDVVKSRNAQRHHSVLTSTPKLGLSMANQYVLQKLSPTSMHTPLTQRRFVYQRPGLPNTNGQENQHKSCIDGSLSVSVAQQDYGASSNLQSAERQSKKLLSDDLQNEIYRVFHSLFPDTPIVARISKNESNTYEFPDVSYPVKRTDEKKHVGDVDAFNVDSCSRMVIKCEVADTDVIDDVETEFIEDNGDALVKFEGVNTSVLAYFTEENSEVVAKHQVEECDVDVVSINVEVKPAVKYSDVVEVKPEADDSDDVDVGSSDSDIEKTNIDKCAETVRSNEQSASWWSQIDDDSRVAENAVRMQEATQDEQVTVEEQPSCYQQTSPRCDKQIAVEEQPSCYQQTSPRCDKQIAVEEQPSWHYQTSPRSDVPKSGNQTVRTYERCNSEESTEQGQPSQTDVDAGHETNLQVDYSIKQKRISQQFELTSNSSMSCHCKVTIIPRTNTISRSSQGEVIGNRHRKTHHCNRDVSCVNNNSVIPKSLKQHVSSTTVSTLSQCEVPMKDCCSVVNESFNMAKGLPESDGKLKVIMPTKNMLYMCDHCGKGYNRIDNLYRHLQVCHYETLPYKCAFCQLAFLSNTTFGRHVRKKHSGKKSYACTFCRVLFLTVETLLSHMATHIIEKPFKCNGCSLDFIIGAKLQLHEFECLTACNRGICDQMSCHSKDCVGKSSHCSESSGSLDPCDEDQPSSHNPSNRDDNDRDTIPSQDLSSTLHDSFTTKHLCDNTDNISCCNENKRETVQCGSESTRSSQEKTRVACSPLTIDSIGTLKSRLSTDGDRQRFTCTLCDKVVDNESQLHRHQLHHADESNIDLEPVSVQMSYEDDVCSSPEQLAAIEDSKLHQRPVVELEEIVPPKALLHDIKDHLCADVKKQLTRSITTEQDVRTPCALQLVLKSSDTTTRAWSLVKNASHSLSSVQQCSPPNRRTKHKLNKSKTDLENYEEFTPRTRGQWREQTDEESEVLKADEEYRAFKCSVMLLPAYWTRLRDHGDAQLSSNISHASGRTLRERLRPLSHSIADGESGLLECTQCDRTFRQAYHLRQHVLNHRVRERGGFGSTWRRTRSAHCPTKVDLNWRRLSKRICDAVFKAKSNTRKRLKTTIGHDELSERALVPVETNEPLTSIMENFKFQSDSFPIAENGTATEPCWSSSKSVSTNGSSEPSQLVVDCNVFSVLEHDARATEHPLNPREEAVSHCSNEELSGEMASTRVKVRKCAYCFKRFWFKSTLLLHEQRIHNKIRGASSNVASSKSFICNFCDVAFVSQDDLKDHILVHAGDKPFVCNACGKAFALKKCLKKHVLKHARKYQLVCNICNGKFASHSSLQRHSLIHTGEKSHSCHICSKAFARRDMLRTHNRTHSN